MRVIIALAVLLPFLAACGGPTSGTVIAKRYEKAEHWQEWDSCKHNVQYDDDGDGFTDDHCTGGYEDRYDDPDFKLHLESCKEEGTKGKLDEDGKDSYRRECKRGWVNVKPEVFERIKVGQHFDGEGRVRDWDSDHRGWG